MERLRQGFSRLGKLGKGLGNKISSVCRHASTRVARKTASIKGLKKLPGRGFLLLGGGGHAGDINRSAWLDYLNSREFEELTGEVFDEETGGLEGATLTKDRADDAAKALRDRLCEKVNGRLPKPPNSGKILDGFDENHDGKLDKCEFQRFARIYFSRLKWPVWKVAVKGTAVGMGTWFLYRNVARPFICSTVLKFVNTALPGVVSGFANSFIEDKIKNNLVNAYAGMKTRLSDGNPFLSAEESGEIRERSEQMDADQQMEELKSAVKGYLTAGVVGTAIAITSTSV